MKLWVDGSLCRRRIKLTLEVRMHLGHKVLARAIRGNGIIKIRFGRVLLAENMTNGFKVSLRRHRQDFCAPQFPFQMPMRQDKLGEPKNPKPLNPKPLNPWAVEFLAFRAHCRAWLLRNGGFPKLGVPLKGLIGDR